MLDGVTPFPAEFAARYRERGYWQDRPLFDGFRDCLRQHADQVALIDADGPVTYRQLNERSARLARALLDLGFGPLDRVVVQLPNTATFAYLYFALQRIGAIPVLALPVHRKREITQFAEISGASALAVPARAFTPDGFYRSGDVLRKLPSGNYVVEGRVKDLINRGGEKISAEEVENLILAHPAVLNVACVPYPDPVLGERMCACVVLRPGRRLGFDELALRNLCPCLDALGHDRFCLGIAIRLGEKRAPGSRWRRCCAG